MFNAQDSLYCHPGSNVFLYSDWHAICILQIFDIQQKQSNNLYFKRQALGSIFSRRKICFCRSLSIKQRKILLHYHSLLTQSKVWSSCSYVLWILFEINKLAHSDSRKRRGDSSSRLIRRTWEKREERSDRLAAPTQNLGPSPSRFWSSSGIHQNM